MRPLRILALAGGLALVTTGCEPPGRAQAELIDPADTASAPTLLRNPRLATDTAPPVYRARFQTTEGDFVVEVRRDWSPRGADRFWNLIRANYYDSVYVHRVTHSLAQFGFHRDPRINALWLPRYIGDDPVAESNTRGRVTFAHAGMNTRSTQIFINKIDNEVYDEQRFVPFGEVVEGMDVVDALYSEYGDMPPDGTGPSPGQAAYRGNEYFETEFPRLTQILTISVDDPPTAP